MSYIPRMKNGDLRLILAMREPYLSQLLSGEKAVEVRRTSPKKDILRNAKTLRLYLYKGGQIHGYVDVSGYATLSDVYFLGAWESMRCAACLTDEELGRYLWQALPDRAIFYCVRNSYRYKKPHKFGTTVQSWIYADQDFIHHADTWEVES